MLRPVPGRDAVVVFGEDRSVGCDQHGSERFVACLERRGRQVHAAAQVLEV